MVLFVSICKLSFENLLSSCRMRWATEEMIRQHHQCWNSNNKPNPQVILQTQASNHFPVYLARSQLVSPLAAVTPIMQKALLSQMHFQALLVGAFRTIALLREVDIIQMVHPLEMLVLEAMILTKTRSFILSASMILLWIWTQIVQNMNLIYEILYLSSQ